jgi:NTE family protein
VADKKKVAVACQGGGMHVAFAVGVLTEILADVKDDKFDLVGISGTSAGALCALMVGCSLAKNAETTPIAERAKDAISNLDTFWKNFVAVGLVERTLNDFTHGVFKFEELELFGINAPIFATLNPYGSFYREFANNLLRFQVREEYFDLMACLKAGCPDFKHVDWDNAPTRVLVGASEVVQGFETAFDSHLLKTKQKQPVNNGKIKTNPSSYWRQRLPLSLESVAASGALPFFSRAQHIDGYGDYWDGLYSQNPPVREFFDAPVDEAGKNLSKKDHLPDELWIIRINPQQWPYVPNTNKDIQDRQNELMGNLSLNKELDFIMAVNQWIKDYPDFAKAHKHVTVRTIKMKKKTADDLSYSSKFNRSREFLDDLRGKGEIVGREWLREWHDNKAGEYPQDAGYCKESPDGG